MTDLAESPIDKRFDHLFNVIRSTRFLKMQGLGNEVPFFICPFKPQEREEIADLFANLVRRLSNNGIQVLAINLYDLTVDLLKERGLWERVLESEPDLPKAELKELLQSVFDPEHHLVPAIVKQMEAQDFDVLFLTGVGEVFPYIRSHTVLNNLQSKAKTKPTVMFFPGKYTHSLAEGASLDLFGILHDDKYYRAFNIYHYQI